MISKTRIPQVIRTQQRLVAACLFSIFFWLFSFGNIGSLSITPPFICCSLYICFSLISLFAGNLILSKKRLFVFLFLSSSFILSCLLSPYGSNWLSLFLYIFYFSIPALLDVRTKINDLRKLLKIFLSFSMIFAVYAIYQFVAYNFITFLPFKELIPEHFWQSKMNVVSTIRGFSFGGLELIRAHSIYPEASFLSQVSAISILIALFMKKQIKNITRLLIVFINLACIVISLSGTGIVILLFGFAYYFFKSSAKTKMFYVFLGTTIILFFTLINSSLFNFYIYRAKEIITIGSQSSGYYRFTLPFEIVLKNKDAFLFGYGIGNDDIALSMFGAVETGVANGFGKIFLEMGFVGIICMILFFITSFNKPERNNSIVRLFILICLINNIVGTFMLPFFWCFIIFTSAMSQNCNYKKSSTPCYL